jgi:hypothetical protein
LVRDDLYTLHRRGLARSPVVAAAWREIVAARVESSCRIIRSESTRSESQRGGIHDVDHVDHHSADAGVPHIGFF